MTLNSSNSASKSRPHIKLWAASASLIMVAAFAIVAPANATRSLPRAGAQPPKHTYPTIAVARAGRASATPNPANLLYNGGPVVTGPPRVYLVFWGSQWGTGSAQTGFSQDPSLVAPRLVQLFQGIGARVPDGNPNTVDPYEQYSNTTKWFCQGVTTGTDGLNAQSGCPSKSAANHVGYPTDGALAGIYNDTATAEPSFATQSQLATEADRAAAHFGNVSGNAQYVIVSAHGTHPDGFFNNQWCAWHSYSSGASPVAFTNMPYLPDAGASCGAGFINGASGPLDGVTIVGGHEYSETVTDPRLNAWFDLQGAENSDKCAWISGSSNPQANAQNVRLSTGTFPLQSNWLNSAEYNGLTGSCRISTK